MNQSPTRSARVRDLQKRYAQGQLEERPTHFWCPDCRTKNGGRRDRPPSPCRCGGRGVVDRAQYNAIMAARNAAKKLAKLISPAPASDESASK